jgi:signal transduction histidine kinase
MATNIDLQWVVPPDAERLIVCVDQFKISQVIRNIVSNAYKFTPSGGTITISLEIVDDQAASMKPTSVRINIADNGLGLTEV